MTNDGVKTIEERQLSAESVDLPASDTTLFSDYESSFARQSA
jgi:hypothetical protein